MDQSPTPVQPTPVNPQPANHQPTSEAGKGLGIAGLILAFFAPVIGLILSIVALVQSKKVGYKNTPALIGVILSSIFIVLGFIFMLLIFLSIPALQRNSRDTARKNDVAVLQSSLLEYYSERGSYPTSLNQVTQTTSLVNDPSEYRYAPEDCTARGCAEYTLSTTLEQNNQIYTVTSEY